MTMKTFSKKHLRFLVSIGRMPIRQSLLVTTDLKLKGGYLWQ
jgi:hypothetical protein